MRTFQISVEDYPLIKLYTDISITYILTKGIPLFFHLISWNCVHFLRRIYMTRSNSNIIYVNADQRLTIDSLFCAAWELEATKHYNRAEGFWRMSHSYLAWQWISSINLQRLIVITRAVFRTTERQFGGTFRDTSKCLM